MDSYGKIATTYVVSVNILPPFVRALFCWAAQHTTVCIDILTLFGHVTPNCVCLDYYIDAVKPH